LSITAFVVDLLKDSSSIVVSTDNLLLVVESTGSCAPYANGLHLRRQVLGSLDIFVRLLRQHSLRSSMTDALDP
jgi:hypothetical protein